MSALIAMAVLIVASVTPSRFQSGTRIMPPEGAKFLLDQRFDIRVETQDAGVLRVLLDGVDITARDAAPAAATFLARDASLSSAGAHTIEAVIGADVRARVTLEAQPWRDLPAPPVKNIIFLLGDGMGIAQRTAARVLARGYKGGKANGLLAMDAMEATGLVMTSSLNALVTDSAPGMAAYSTGNKGNNNQEGVFPDDTPGDPFDNPRVEYLGEILRRTRGPGFELGIVTTADVTDATPAANAVHTANRMASPGIAQRYCDEREHTALAVLMGGGRRHFVRASEGGSQPSRDLIGELGAAGFAYAATATEMQAWHGDAVPSRVLGLFHLDHMTTAFDKIGYRAGYSLELTPAAAAPWRDQPMLDDMAAVALRVLEHGSTSGFCLLIEGASIDKRAHDQDAERMIWDTIEFDRAVGVALAFARRTNGDQDPWNDTLVIVTADHECGGAALIGVGNERYYPPRLGRAVRDYVATLRFQPQQELELFPNYVPDERGYPVHPDPTRKLIVSFAAGPDRYENFISNRYQLDAAIATEAGVLANPDRDGPSARADASTVEGERIAGLFVSGLIENGAHRDPSAPADTSSLAFYECNHTASDVPLSASGPGALTFTGTYDNTEVFFKMMRLAGAWRAQDTDSGK
ncbi:MAG: alkaline phosphatase [Planctomycetota bacterium]